MLITCIFDNVGKCMLKVLKINPHLRQSLSFHDTFINNGNLRPFLELNRSSRWIHYKVHYNKHFGMRVTYKDLFMGWCCEALKEMGCLEYNFLLTLSIYPRYTDRNEHSYERHKLKVNIKNFPHFQNNNLWCKFVLLISQ